LHRGFLNRPILRWLVYAISFGLLWGLVAHILLSDASVFASLARGVAGGIFFATVAIVREQRGRRRGRRRRRGKAI
jgi:hypothetical protein